MIEYPCGREHEASQRMNVCEPGLRVKFCTCSSEEPLDYPRWELWRTKKEPDEWGVHAVGSIMPSPLEHRLLTDRVLQDLNRRDAFDMDLGFRDGDRLVLHWHEDDRMTFGYDGRRWSDSWGWGLGGSSEGEPVAAGRLEGHRR